jgi:hypothetical protein
MKSFVLFFNAANRYNGGAPDPRWRRDQERPRESSVNHWVVGVMESDGYVTEQSIDNHVEVLNHWPNLEQAIHALKSYVDAQP